MGGGVVEAGVVTVTMVTTGYDDVLMRRLNK